MNTELIEKPMSNELDSQLAALIESARQTGSDVASFIQQQAPELCQQIISWQTTISTIGVCAFGLLFIVGLVMLFVGAFKESEGTVCVGCTFLISIIPLGVNVYSLVKVLTAPKLVLIEHISSLLK